MSNRQLYREWLRLRVRKMQIFLQIRILVNLFRPLSTRDVLVIKCTAFYIAANETSLGLVINAKKVANVNDGRV